MSRASWKTSFGQFVNSVWAPAMVGGLIAFLIILNQVLSMRPDPPVEIPQADYSPVREKIGERLSEVFSAHEIPFQKGAGGAPEVWSVRLPADVPITDIHTAVHKGLSAVQAGILASESDPVTGRLALSIGQEDTCLIELVFQKDERKRSLGKIAIIIDDFGDRNDAFAHSFLSLPGEVTISVIPGRGMSNAIAQTAVSLGNEVMLHLPMEPLRGAYPKDGFTLRSEMTQSQVRRIFRTAVQEVPQLAGFNNHMGSRVTADRRIMTYLMEAVRETDYYFVDSRTTAETVAYAVASSSGIPCAKRDVFLDDRSDKSYIRRQMQALAAKSEQMGYAVGIGHCGRTTLEVLREEIPKLQEAGYRFVRVSDIVR